MHILTLLFQGMMPHNSHIPMDEMRPPILSYRNYIITFVLFFFHIFMHMYIFMLILFFSFAETGGIWVGGNVLDLHWRSSSL